MNHIDSSIEKIGKMVAWVNVVLIIVFVVDVALRYLFDNSKNWVIELEWHLFAFLFLIGVSYALQKDEHVRVDLFYQNYSDRKKVIVNLMGHIFFLIPWSIVIIKSSWRFAMNSYSFSEGSPTPGGLPYRYIIKFVIVVGIFLLLVQGLSQIWSYTKQLIKK